MHSQDRKSRQRCSKPRRQCELSGETTQLSLGYLFCHNRGPLKAIDGSLGQPFSPAFLAFQKTVRQAFALALYSRFPTWMSLSLGPTDIFSAGCRPSQTARLLVSSKELAYSSKIGSITRLSRLAETTRILLPILCTFGKYAATSCSKGPQGLSFPLDISGPFTWQYVQKLLARDSDNFVGPFMQVVIQATRYYATLRASGIRPAVWWTLAALKSGFRHHHWAGFTDYTSLFRLAIGYVFSKQSNHPCNCDLPMPSNIKDKDRHPFYLS